MTQLTKQMERNTLFSQGWSGSRMSKLLWFNSSCVRASSLHPVFHSNAIACVACVACIWKPQETQALVISRNKRKRQPIEMLGRSSGNHDWLLANTSACVSCGFHLHHARNASDCVWMENGLTSVWARLPVRVVNAAADDDNDNDDDESFYNVSPWYAAVLSETGQRSDRQWCCCIETAKVLTDHTQYTLIAAARTTRYLADKDKGINTCYIII